MTFLRVFGNQQSNASCCGEEWEEVPTYNQPTTRLRGVHREGFGRLVGWAQH